MNSSVAAASFEAPIRIGGVTVNVRTSDVSFYDMLAGRYAGYLDTSAEPEFHFDVELVAPGAVGQDEDAEVSTKGAEWTLRRGDFRAQWNPVLRRGRIWQSPNPYSIDSVLRIVHTLVLARKGGFLLHAASAVCDGRAFLFAGVSGAGKTTISRLAPPDVTLLTDEISYVRPDGAGYRAFGTPFSGELAEPGENTSAPVAALYLLGKAADNRIEAVEPSEAVRGVLQNILFFAKEQQMVNAVFLAACAFAARVPVQRLWFAPTEQVWSFIR